MIQCIDIKLSDTFRRRHTMLNWPI